MGRAVRHDNCQNDWYGAFKERRQLQFSKLQDMKGQGVVLQCIIGDKDSSAIRHLRDEVDEDIINCSDLNQLKKKYW